MEIDKLLVLIKSNLILFSHILWNFLPFLDYLDISGERKLGKRNHNNKERLWTLTKCLPFLNSNLLVIWILYTLIPYQRVVSLLGKETQQENFIDEGNQSKDNSI